MQVETNQVKRAYQYLLLVAVLISATPIAAQERTPLEKFIDGFPMELEKQTRAASYDELFKGGDVSAYFNVRVAEFMNTAVLPSRQPVLPLGHRPMPEVGLVKAEMLSESELEGTLTLDQFMAQSDFTQAYLVVHKGDIVYETYPRIRREEAHLWMSSAKPMASLIVDLLISEGKITAQEGARLLTALRGASPSPQEPRAGTARWHRDPR